MTVTYHSGERIQGTQSDFDGTPATQGGWKEIGRVNASVGEITGLADKRYLMVLGHHIQGSGNSGLGLQLNGDTTGGNYPRRYSENGGSDATPTSETNVFFDTNGSTESGKEWFTAMYIANKSDKEKLGIYDTVYNRNGVGADEYPHRLEGVFKWANTSASISSIKFSDFNGTAMNSASEVVVLGWDPADSHTTNFWEQLADVSLSSAGDNLSSGTFTAKKYLWVQAFIDSNGGNVNDAFRCGNGSVDTGTNYSYRFSTNGGADSTSTSQNDIGDFSNISNGQFINMFIVNNASNEKLIICHINEGKTGAGTAPTRLEIAGKWANTSDQINVVEWRNPGSNDYSTKSFIKVWGSN